MISKKASVDRRAATWEDRKAIFKVMFPQLTDGDLDYDETKRDEMLTNLQVKLRRTAKELQAIIEKL